MKRHSHRAYQNTHEIPPQAFSEAATLVLCGKGEGTVSGVLRLVSYAENEIVLTLCDRREVRIYGQGLSIALISRDVLRIHGKIHGCAFTPRGNADAEGRGETQ